jgi:hypothetical protein
MSMRRILLPVIAISALLVAGCDSGPAAESGDTIVAAPPVSTTPAPTPPQEPATTPEAAPEPSGDTALGTRANPAPFGATAQIGDWQVTLLTVDLDAEERVLAENMFNDRAPEGFRHILIEVEATYVGSDSGDPFWDLSWKLVGNRGNTFEDSCGVIPTPLRDGGETFPGGAVTGNICVVAPEDQLAGGAVIAEGLFRESRTFFSLP